MKTVLAIAMIVGGASGALAQSYGYGNSYGGYGSGSNSSSHAVQGHYNNNGTYTQPHHSTNPNSSQLDNYSTRGNVNPYTGAVGTRAPRF